MLPYKAIVVQIDQKGHEAYRRKAEGIQEKGFIPSPECPNRLRDRTGLGFKTPHQIFNLVAPVQEGSESPSEQNLLPTEPPAFCLLQFICILAIFVAPSAVYQYKY